MPPAATAETPGPGPGAAPVGWGALLAYGTPAAAYAFYLFFIQFYFLKFATDVLLAAPAVIGALMGVGRIWDAFSDPLVGYWSDRTRSRWGRRRPWMLAAIPLLAVSSIMVWSPPTALGPGALVAWSAVALLGFYTSYTIYSIPHASLGAEISTDHHQRTRVFGAQRVAFVLGMMAAFAAIGVATNADDRRATALVLAVAGAVAASALLLAAPAGVRERVEYQGRGAGSPWQALRDVARNPHARILLFAWFVEGLGGGVLGVLSPYLTEYVIGRPDLIAVVPAFFVVASVASIPVWIALSRRFGKRNVWVAAVTANGLFFGAIFFVGPGDIPLLSVLLVGAGFANGCGGAIGASMLADVIDYDELRSGERKEGAYSAAWGFSFKLSIGLVVILTGFALQLAGFEPNVQQTRTAELTLRGLFSGAPLVASLLAAAILLRFRLDAREHGRIRAELDGRGGD